MKSSSSNGSNGDSSALGNIEHVSAPMCKNRAFDHILRAMPGVDGVLDDVCRVPE